MFDMFLVLLFFFGVLLFVSKRTATTVEETTTTETAVEETTTETAVEETATETAETGKTGKTGVLMDCIPHYFTFSKTQWRHYKQFLKPALDNKTLTKQMCEDIAYVVLTAKARNLNGTPTISERKAAKEIDKLICGFEQHMPNKRAAMHKLDKFISRTLLDDKQYVSVANQTQELLDTFFSLTGIRRTKLDLQFFAGAATDTDSSGSANKNKEGEAMIEESKRLTLALKLRQRRETRKDIYAGDRYTMTSFDIKKDYENNSWFCGEKQITQQLGEITRAFVEEHNCDYVVDSKGRKIYDLNELFQITFCNNFLTVRQMMRLWKKDNNFYFLSLDQKQKNKFEMVSNDGSVKNKTVYYTNICDKTDVISDVSDAELYVGISHGAAGARKLANLYMPHTKAARYALNQGSHGISDKLLGAIMPSNKVQNSVVRIMAGLTGSKVIGKYDNIAMYVGDFGMGTKIDGYNALSEKGLNELKKTMDGIAFYDGFGSRQQRNNSTKVFAYGIPKFTLDVLLQKYEQVVFDLTDESQFEDAQKALDAVFLKTDEELKDKLNNKILVFKKNPATDVEFYSDTNGFKTTWDLSMDFNIPVLDMPQRNHSGLSKQFINKMYAINPSATDKLVKELGEEAVNTIIGGLFESTPLGIEDLNDPYFNMLVNKFAPEWADYDISIRETNVKLALNSFAKLVNKFKIPVKESANLRAIPDIGAYIGVNILPDNAIFTRDIPADTLAILIKYPTIGLKEFLEVTVWGLKDVIKRINELQKLKPEVVTDDIKKAMIGYYANLDVGCVIMANSKRLMNLLAGFDFDYDMLIAFFDKRIIELFKGATPEMVDIKTNDPAIREVRFVIEAIKGMVDGFEEQGLFDPLASIIASQSSSVGAITVEYDFFIQVLNLWLKEDAAGTLKNKKNSFCKMLEAILDVSFIQEPTEIAAYLAGKEKITLDEFVYVGQPVNEKGTFVGAPDVISKQRINAPKAKTARYTDYVGLTVHTNDSACSYVKITEEARTAVAEQLKTCMITPDNFVKIISDIVRIARYDQEVTIDSVKTFIFVVALFIINSYFGCFGRKEYEYELVEVADNKQKTTRIMRKAIELKKVWHINDIYAQYRDHLEAYALPKFDDYLQRPVKVSETIDELCGVFDGNAALNNAINILGNLKTLYSMVASHAAQSDDTRVKVLSKIVYKTIRDIGRTALQGSNIEDSIGLIGGLMYYLSTATKDDRIKEHKSSFNNTCFPFETLMFAGAVTGKVSRIAEKLLFVSDDVTNMVNNGKKVYLTFDNGNGYMDGSDKIHAIADSRIENDDFLIQPIDETEVLYATDSLENYAALNDYLIENALFVLDGEVALSTGDSIFIKSTGTDNICVLVNEKKQYISGAYKYLVRFEKNELGRHYTADQYFIIPKSIDEKTGRVYDAKTIVIALPKCDNTNTSEDVHVEHNDSYESCCDSSEQYEEAFISDEERETMLSQDEMGDYDFSGYESCYSDELTY